jgi:hypothetical protein
LVDPAHRDVAPAKPPAQSDGAVAARPDLNLLRAQTALLDDPGQSGARFASGMRDYRSRWLQKLSAAYTAQQDLQSWLGGNLSVHGQVDAALRSKDYGAASELLSNALAAAPAGVAADDLRRIRQDLYFRSSQISFMTHDYVRTLQLADAGLALGDAEDLFAANLWMARVTALVALKRANDAAASYGHAHELNQRLLVEADSTAK